MPTNTISLQHRIEAVIEQFLIPDFHNVTTLFGKVEEIFLKEDMFGSEQEWKLEQKYTSFSSKAQHVKKTLVSSSQSLSILTCVITLGELSEKTKPTGVCSFHLHSLFTRNSIERVVNFNRVEPFRVIS